MRAPRIITLLVVLWLAALVGYAQTPKLQPLNLDDAIAGRSFGIYQHLAFSPDGKWIAYTIIDTTRRLSGKGENPFAGSEVWITNTETGESKNLTDEKHIGWSPVWSPDGRYLAYYDQQDAVASLWVWDSSSGNSRKVLEKTKSNFFEAGTWAGADRFLTTVPSATAAATASAGKAADLKGDGTKPTVMVYNSPAAPKDGKGNEKLRDGSTKFTAALTLLDIVLVDVKDGKARTIATSVTPQQLQVSPDGGTLAYLNIKSLNTDGGFYQVGDLTLAGLAEGAQSRVAVQSVGGGRISWSPDGKQIAYSAVPGDCFVVGTGASDTPRKLAADKHPPFDDQFRAPLWDRSGQFLYFVSGNAVWKVSVNDGKAVEAGKIADRNLGGIVAPATPGRFWSPDDGQSAIVSTRNMDTKDVGFYSLNLSNGQSRKLLEENKNYGPFMVYTSDITRDGSRIAYVAQDASHGEDVWITGPDFQSPKRLTNINPKFNEYVFGQTRLIDYRTIDGEKVHGALLLPAGYEEGKRYPMIVFIYGGSNLSNSLNEFGLEGQGVFDMQIFATRGYAVLFPDTPLHVGTPMQDLLKTVLPAADKVVEMGIADPDRIGVMGHSYGGYSTLSLIVQTTRFKAAISMDGPANLLNSYGQMNKDGFSIDIGWAENKGSQGRMEASPWELRDRYIENSPVFFLDRVETPLLIIQGEQDGRVPQHLSDEVFVDMRRLGKEVSYAKYLGEDHSPLYWGYANMKDLSQRLIDWFDGHLRASARD